MLLPVVALLGARSPRAHYHTQVTSVHPTVARSADVQTSYVTIQLVAACNELHESSHKKLHISYPR